MPQIAESEVSCDGRSSATSRQTCHEETGRAGIQGRPPGRRSLLGRLRRLTGLEPPRLLATAGPVVLVVFAASVDGKPDRQLIADRFDVVIVQPWRYDKV